MFEKNGAPMMVILTLAILLAASVKITLLAGLSLLDPTVDLSHFRHSPSSITKIHEVKYSAALSYRQI